MWKRAWTMSSHRVNENRKRQPNFHEGSPPQGPFGARRGSFCVFQRYQSLIRRGGAPSGAAANIIIRGMGVSTPIILSYSIFIEKSLYPWRSRWGCSHIPLPVPAASQTTTPPAFVLHTIAIFDLFRSRRGSVSNSSPVPHFSGLWPLKFWEWEK